MTSGSWRSAALSASAKECASVPELALVDDAVLVRVHELDRVLDGEDVLVARLVDLVDHRGERRRLARAGRAGDEHQAARLAGELADDRRQAELLDRHRLGRDQTEGGADRAALEEGVDAEAALARHRVGEVELMVGLQALALGVVEDRVDDLARVGRRQLREALDRRERAAHAQHRRNARGDVEVGRVALDDCGEDVSEVEVHAFVRIGRTLDGLKCGAAVSSHGPRATVGDIDVRGDGRCRPRLGDPRLRATVGDIDVRGDGRCRPRLGLGGRTTWSRRRARSRRSR